MVKIYTASCTRHAELWLNLRKEFPTVYFTARWPFMIGRVEESPRTAKLFWQDDFADIARSDIVLLYAEPEDRLRGALIAVGIGLGLNKTINLIGEHKDYGSWQFYPWIEKFDDLDGFKEWLQAHG